MSKYAKLDDICKRLGYHGICPEALEELINIRPMVDDFMAGMRQMFAPREEGPIEFVDEYQNGNIEVLETIDSADIHPTDDGVTGQRHAIAKQLRSGAIDRDAALTQFRATGMTLQRAQERVLRILLERAKSGEVVNMPAGTSVLGNRED
jgi:hypothetical protein